MTKRRFGIFKSKVERNQEAVKKHFDVLESKVDQRFEAIEQKFLSTLSQLRADTKDWLRKEKETQIRITLDAKEAVIEAEKTFEDAEKVSERLKKELDSLRSLDRDVARCDVQKDTVSISKASTLSIFDSIIFAISNWSTDGQTAPDVELACQSILFPIVYEKVMSGNSDYFITQVPPSALEVVRRGRLYVQHLRSSCDVLLTDDKVWSEYAPDIQEWWVNDALPLLYGARDDDWNISTSFQLAEVLEWRDMPASRALHFPLIFDGMELVKTHADDIRKSTGLPDFNKQQLLTRIEP